MRTKFGGPTTTRRLPQNKSDRCINGNFRFHAKIAKRRIIRFRSKLCVCCVYRWSAFVGNAVNIVWKLTCCDFRYRRILRFSTWIRTAPRYGTINETSPSESTNHLLNTANVIHFKMKFVYHKIPLNITLKFILCWRSCYMKCSIFGFFWMKFGLK